MPTAENRDAEKTQRMQIIGFAAGCAAMALLGCNELRSNCERGKRELR